MGWMNVYCVSLSFYLFVVAVNHSLVVDIEVDINVWVFTHRKIQRGIKCVGMAYQHNGSQMSVNNCFSNMQLHCVIVTIFLQNVIENQYYPPPMHNQTNQRQNKGEFHYCKFIETIYFVLEI